MNEAALRELLERVRCGAVGVDQAVDRLRRLPYENLGFARIDHHRALRKGAPEVVFCEGKTPEQAATIFARIFSHAGLSLGTRADEGHAQAIRERVPSAEYFPAARVVMAGVQRVSFQTADADGARVAAPSESAVAQSRSTDSEAPARTGQPFVLVASGGTVDLPVAEEAALTAEFLGARVERLYDVGIAGLHRLLDQQALLMSARMVVAVAGMDGALPGLIAGLVSCPVIAVPTSAGYGTGLGGLAALMNMLNACAPGLAVVNIDNGFGGGYLAAMILRAGK